MDILTKLGFAAALLAAGCGGTDGSASASLASEAFVARTAQICSEHEIEMDRVFSAIDIMATDTDEELEAELERGRRMLLDLKRDLLAELGKVEPRGREPEWALALAEFEAALDASGSGDRVDVRVDGAFETVSLLIDDFGLETCF